MASPALRRCFKCDQIIDLVVFGGYRSGLHLDPWAQDLWLVKTADPESMGQEARPVF